MSCPHSAVALRACRRRSQCAVSCFRGLWVWRVLVPVIEITAVFVRLRLRLRQRRPPATPASDARQRRPPATPRHDPKRTGGARGRFCRSRKQPRHVAVAFSAKHPRAEFWRVSCVICCASIVGRGEGPHMRGHFAQRSFPLYHNVTAVRRNPIFIAVSCFSQAGARYIKRPGTIT